MKQFNPLRPLLARFDRVDPRSEASNLTIKLLLFFFGFLIFTRFQIDPDFGWHLAIGEKFLRDGQIVTVDEYSWTMPGYLWGNSYFLYQVLVAYLFAHFGFFLTAIFFGFLAALGIVLCVYKNLNLVTIFFVAVGSVVAIATLGIRPHTISLLMFSLLLVLLEKGFFKFSLFWFFFFALWANFHRGFVIGILVLGVYIFLDYIRLKSIQKRVRVRPRVAVVVFAILGTFLTPAPFLIWKSAVFDDLTSRTNLFFIAEWQSITFYFPINLVFALSGLIFIYILFRKFKEIEPQWFLTAAFLFALAFVSATFAFFWAAIFIFLVTRHWDFTFKMTSGALEKLFIGFASTCAILIIFLGTVGNFLQSYNLGARLLFDSYPVQAIKFMTENNLYAGLFNEYGWGGFIDWQMPEAKVFIDGRMASWRRPGELGILNDYININMGRCESIEKYEVRTVLVKADANVACFSNFRTVYEDSIAKVLIE